MVRLVLFALAVVGAAAVAYSMSLGRSRWRSPCRRRNAAEIVTQNASSSRALGKVTPLVRERIVELCGCERLMVDKAICSRGSTTGAQATLDELIARHRYASHELSACATSLRGT